MEYISINDNCNFYYGGNQMLFPIKKLKNYGCGLVGMADLLLCLNRKCSNKYKHFPKDNNGSYDKEEYIDFARRLAYSFCPISYLIKGTTGFFLAIGFNLFAYIYGIKYRAVWGISKKKMLPRIKDMINNDIPVIFSVGTNFPLIFSKKGVKLYSTFANDDTEKLIEVNNALKHYMIITDVIETKKYNTILKVSSWGKRYYIIWDEYMSYIKYKSNSLFCNILYVK